MFKAIKVNRNSMATLNKIKVSLRTDDLSNWISADPILNDGEVAIVNDENGNQLFKIGNGVSAFSELAFFNENALKTKNISSDQITAKNIAQGLKASAVPLGLAAGAFLSANANFSQAFGFNCEVSSGHDYSFIWSGDDQRTLGNYYISKDRGTFCINPKNGLSGFYIGDDSLCTIIDAQVSSKAEAEDLTAFYQKAQTSSSLELTDEFSRYQLSGDYLSVSEFTYTEISLDEED